MRLLIVSQYFPPEPFRVGDLAVGLRDLGNEVEVLTAFPAYPSDHLYPGYRLRLRQRDTYQGIPVVRVPFYPGYGASGLKRALNSLSFALSGSVLGPLLVRAPEAILIYQVSPVTMVLPALAVRAVRGGRVFLWVQDLWPDTLEGLGIVRSPLVLRALGGVMRFVGRRCERVLVQSEGMIEPVVARGIPRARVAYVPNWAEELYQVGTPDAAFLRTEGLGREFTVLFAGNVGVSQNLHVMLDAAEGLRDHPDIQFVVVGDGADLPAVQERARARGLTNVVFKGRQPVEKMPLYFAGADVLLVHLRLNPVFAMTVPSKLQSYLASGRPVLAALRGSGAEIVRRAQAGVVCEPDSGDALRAAVLALWAMPRAEREALGRNARRFYEQHFERRLVLSRLQALMEERT